MKRRKHRCIECKGNIDYRMPHAKYCKLCAFIRYKDRHRVADHKRYLRIKKQKGRVG